MEPQICPRGYDVALGRADLRPYYKKGVYLWDPPRRCVTFRFRDVSSAYDPRIHHRRSIRLKRYDYRSHAAYFITFCVQDRLKILSQIINGKAIHSIAGNALQQSWEAIPRQFPQVDTREMVVMPDHFHGIIILNPSETRSIALGYVVQQLKIQTARRLRFLPGPNPKVSWQRNYYERIIRDETHYATVVRYIQNNPTNYK